MIPCRCLTRTDGVKCTQRKSLPKRPDAYVRQPRCPRCGGRSWYIETYRIRTELPGQVTCDCGAYRHPHRKFSGKCSRLRHAVEYWSTWFGGGSCGECNCLGEDDDGGPYCQVAVGQESARYCAAVQEFEVEHELRSV